MPEKAEYERLRRRFAHAFNDVLAPYYQEGVEKRSAVAFHLADEAFTVLLHEIEWSDVFEAPSAEWGDTRQEARQAGWNGALAAIQDAFSKPTGPKESPGA